MHLVNREGQAAAPALPLNPLLGDCVNSIEVSLHKLNGLIF